MVTYSIKVSSISFDSEDIIREIKCDFKVRKQVLIYQPCQNEKTEKHFSEISERWFFYLAFKNEGVLQLIIISLRMH